MKKVIKHDDMESDCNVILCKCGGTICFDDSFDDMDTGYPVMIGHCTTCDDAYEAVVRTWTLKKIGNQQD